MADIAKLRELLEKASPGPWSLSGIGRLLSSDRYCIGDGVYGPDADFILAMYQALPELLAIAEGAEADRADARRYRYLRDKAPAGAGEMASVRDSHSAREIDTAIDSAMAEVSHE